MKQHISQLQNKSAINVLSNQSKIRQDNHHQALIKGAETMVSTGHDLAEYRIGTQEGITVWEIDGKTAHIRPEEWLS